MADDDLGFDPTGMTPEEVQRRHETGLEFDPTGMTPEEVERRATAPKSFTEAATRPITSYPETYKRHWQGSLDLLKSGAKGFTEPHETVLGDIGYGTLNLGKVLAGALGYGFSPFTAAYETVADKPVIEPFVNRPVAKATGSPLMGTLAATAAGTLLPGGGVTRLRAAKTAADALTAIPHVPPPIVSAVDDARKALARANMEKAREFTDVHGRPMELSWGEAAQDPTAYHLEDAATAGAYGKPAQDVALPMQNERFDVMHGAAQKIGQDVGGGRTDITNPNDAAAIIDAEIRAQHDRIAQARQRIEQHAGAEEAAQRQMLADRERALGDIYRGGGEEIGGAREAGEQVGESIRQRATQAREGVTQRYNEAFSLPGQFHAGTFEGVGQRIKGGLTDRPEPVIIDDVTTPIASRAIRDIDESISQLRIQNRADPGGQPNPENIIAVNLRGVDQVRKRLNQWYGAARNAARAGSGTGPSDARAMGAIIDEFDNQIERAISNGLFSGDARALDALRQARAAYRNYAQTYRPQGAGDDVGAAMRRIIDRNATPEEVSNMLIGSGALGGQGLPVRIAQRLEQIFGRDSQEWSSVRQALWQRASQVRRADGAVDANRSAQSITNFANSTLARQVFSPEELAAMRNHAQAVRDLETNLAVMPERAMAERAQQDYTRLFSGREVGGAQGATLQRIIEGRATPDEIVNTVFRAIGSGNAGGAGRIVKAIGNIVGTSSEGYQALRQGVWQKLTTRAEGMDRLGAQKLSQDIFKFIGSGVAKQLYTADELSQMRKFAEVVRLKAPQAGTRSKMNPSGSAISIARIARQAVKLTPIITHGLFGHLGLAGNAVAHGINHWLERFATSGEEAGHALNVQRSLSGAPPQHASGGRAMATGGLPDDVQPEVALDQPWTVKTHQEPSYEPGEASQDAAEAAAARVRAPYAKANTRESGLPDIANYYGHPALRAAAEKGFPTFKSGGRVTDRARAEAALPTGHKLGMRVPRGGSRCGNCRFLSSSTTCGNDGFIEWNGGPDLPAPKDEYCCDLYEHGHAAGGRAMADGGDPGLDDQASAQEAAEAAAARVRAPYARANERVSGLPDVGRVIGNRAASIATAPLEALTGRLQVTDPETGMPTEEAIGRAGDVAGAVVGGGMPGSVPGALGMAGGKLRAPREPTLTPAISHNGKLYIGETHLDALSKVPPEQRAAASLNGDNRVYVTGTGRVMDRWRGQDYAVKNDLLSPDAPSYAKTSPELIGEWLRRPEDAAPARTATRELPGRGELPGGPGVLQAPGGPDLAYGAISTEPLEGLPRKVAIPGQEPIEAGPHMPGRVAAHQYAQEAGLPYDPPKTYAKVDVPRAQRIAQAFDEMKHEPENPEVQRAYSKMIDETMAQWDAIKRTGLKVEFMPPGVDYYAASPRLATEDVRNNNHLWVFSTREGFGTDPATGHAYKPNVKENPLLAETGETISGQPALANDIFRIVHDYFGHIKEGVGFRADGEENAWRSHSAMYSPEARRAMTTETRGQNSWLNHGPHGEKNRTASTADTVFADQKIGLLPDWVVNEGAHDPVQAPAISQRRQLQPGTRHYNKAAEQAWKEIEGQGIGAGPLDLASAAGVPNVPQEEMWRYEPPRGVSPRLQEALQDKNIARAINKSIGAGMELGADKWYHTEPIRRAFVAELGEERGQQAFDQFMHLTAATSPRSNASENIRNASYYYGKLRRGEPLDARNQVPYGHIAQNLHRFHAQRIMDAYRAHDLGAAANVAPWDLKNNPKPASFAENLRGNLAPGTMDTHAFRNIGMRTGDPRFLMTSLTEAFKGNPGPESMVRRFGEVNKPGIATYRPQQLVKEGRLTMKDALNYPTFWTSMPNPNEYAAAENLYRELGRKRGMPTADAQAAAWSGAGQLTGLDSPATHTFPQLFNERVLFTAKMRGEDPMETLRKFIHGREPLLSAGGAVAYRRSGGRVLSHYVDKNPSEAQKRAGNYRKAHISIHGMPIAIENPKGSSRYGVGKDGKPWSVKMPASYGYIKGTVGHDKDHIDVYVGPFANSKKAWVVDQHDSDTGKFDEHKVFVGFGSEEHVRRTYDAAFSDGRGKDRRRRIHATDVAGLKHWLSTMKSRAAA